MIYDKVVDIIKEEFKVDNISENTVIREDLGTDSIGLLELVMAIEDEFDIEISDENLDNIVTVKDIVDNIEKLKK
ncbi:acyl carrier protein [Miniphocaeibacter halophilus]|uniref:Acyl carrier protein n=1 Tax=Miniphocaeibacter halophilus TaxID=2931922 RepID=A0AC61MQ90_9FIRM|nr:acyl carrier protein [Miniphocaeibacter halophilus]QQK07543.1 acyl carrier protein [Miniphocaeibacter halophilus]